MVTLEGFRVDAAQVRSRAVACVLSVVAFGATLTVVWQADDRSVYFQRYSVEGAIGLILIVSALAIIHTVAGLLTDVGVLPRVALRYRAEQWQVTAFSRILQADWLTLDNAEVVKLGGIAARRQGVFGVGYKTQVIIETSERRVTIPVVSGDPAEAVIKIAQLIAGCGIPVEVDADVAYTPLSGA